MPFGKRPCDDAFYHHRCRPGSGAESVTLVLPTYPYSRQHKKRGREALTARWFGQMCEHSGASRIITVDIHSKEIENTFNKLILENLHGSYQIIRALKDLVDLNDPDLVVVSPDTGAVDRNKFYAGNLKKPLALLYKERDYSRVSRDASSSNITNIRLLGDVKGKIVFMADDMLGTGGTLMKAMRELKRLGARQIIAAASLPFLPVMPLSILSRHIKRVSFIESSEQTQSITTLRYLSVNGMFRPTSLIFMHVSSADFTTGVLFLLCLRIAASYKSCCVRSEETEWER